MWLRENDTEFVFKPKTCIAYNVQNKTDSKFVQHKVCHKCEQIILCNGPQSK